MKKKLLKPKFSYFITLIFALIACCWRPLKAQERISLHAAIKQNEKRFDANLSYEHNLLKDIYIDRGTLTGSKLEEVLKKISWRGPTKQWSEREHQLPDRGRPEREEHRDG